MNTSTAATVATLDHYVAYAFRDDPATGREILAGMNYRNRNRWARVMKKWPAARDALVARREHVGPYFEAAILSTIFHAIMGGTRADLAYTLEQMVPEGDEDIMSPLLREMWNGPRF